MPSTTGDAGVDTGAKGLLAFMQVCANGDLTPCIARCFGTMLDKQQRFWIYRLLPSLPPLTTAQLRQAALPIKNGGLGHTLPSDVVMHAYIVSRLDTADAVAAMPGMSDAVAPSQDCSELLAHHVAANQVPAPLGATGWDVPTLRNLTRRKTQHTTESRSRVQRAIRLADQACQYCRRLGDGSH
jgi:hypothetical protein